MKKRLTVIFLLVGGVIAMTGLQGCSPAEKVPDNRTKQQYEIEREFLEMQGVLISKDLEAVKPTFIWSQVYLEENIGSDSNTQTDQYLATLNDKTGSLAGTLTLYENGSETAYSVAFEANKLTIGGDAPQTVKGEDWLFYNLDFPKDYFKNLKVIRVLNHRDIPLKSIIYRETSRSSNTQKLIEKFSLSDNVITTLTLRKEPSTNSKYSYSFTMAVHDKINKKTIYYSFDYAKIEAEEDK